VVRLQLRLWSTSYWYNLWYRMNHSKSILIAIAAFAVTATGAQAYVGTKHLARAGLSHGQISALAEARQLRESGELTKAREVLSEAGIDEDALEKLRQAAVAAKAAMHQAVEAGDYEAFRVAIADTPLADIITSEADFNLFKEAEVLRREGNHEEARELLNELGVPPWPHKNRHPRGAVATLGLSLEQKDALRAARAANDRETVKAILDEAGVRDEWGRGGW
jgi:hypothetical protein